MSPTVLTDLAIVAPLYFLALFSTWRLIWPWWKRLGKPLAFFAIVAVLSQLIGHWSLLFAVLHQGLGLGVHIWFSRKHGFTWYAVEDPERYVALSKEWVGSSS